METTEGGQQTVNDNSLKYRDLRSSHPEFIYEGYSLSENEDSLEIAYHFNVPGLAEFFPSWSFSLISSREASVERRRLEELVFSLGMVELISYWKICCPPIVRVKARKLNAAQIEWWKKMYRKGLGEYFYVNGISAGDDFMDIVSSETAPATDTSLVSPAPAPATDTAKPITDAEKVPKVLIPVGGGKDSVVTLELLREGADRYGYVINPRQAMTDALAVSGIDSEKIITANRALDKNMLALNAQGYLNGHTPFSAIVAFSSTLAGYVNGLDHVALSNESSANETTIANSEVNHQYSKSYEFETDFRRYEREYIGSGVEYFSLLRPLSELQIARLFAKYDKYHSIFRSCNAASKRDEWCGVCPKCLFVFIILSPFLSGSELVSIFHKNIFEDLSLQETLDELVGFVPEKPFECVGSRNEARAALELTIIKYNERNSALPPLLMYYSGNLKRDATPFDPEEMFTSLNEDNAAPQRFLALVKAAVTGVAG